MSITTTFLIDNVLQTVSNSAKLLGTDTNENIMKEVVNRAVLSLSKLAPLTCVDTITLQPGVQMYPAPADIWGYKETSWGFNQQVAPWEPGYVTRLPNVTYSDGHIYFSFAPTSQMISHLGSRFTYFYYAMYTVSDSGVISIDARKQSLLLLLCQIEVMKLLKLREVATQVSVKGVAGKIQYGNPELAAAMLEKEALSLARTL